jgi:hypothetical protein
VSDKLSETEGNPQAEKLKRMWKIVVLVAILVTNVLIAFVALMVYATSVKVQTWGMTKKYEEGFWLVIQWRSPKFSATIKLAIGNPGLLL